MQSKKELKLEIEKLKIRLENEQNKSEYLRESRDRWKANVFENKNEIYDAQSDARAASEKCRLYETLLYHHVINLSDDTTLINKNGMVFAINKTTITQLPSDSHATIEVEGICVGRWDKDGDYVGLSESCKSEGSDV